MLGMKGIFVVALVLAVLSSILGFAATMGFKFTLESIAVIAVAGAVVACVAILLKFRGSISYRLSTHRKPIKTSEKLAEMLCINALIPCGNYVLVEDTRGKLIGHAYFRITNIPYLIDDLDKDRKMFYVGNFVRTLSTLTFPFELIPRIMPVPTDAYMASINKSINDLRLTLSAEGSVADPARQARLRNLERIASRLLEGEGTRDVSFLVHIIVHGKDEAQISRELEANTKTLMSTLEMGLNVKAERLSSYAMMEAVKEFFRASVNYNPSKACRMLCWDLAYLVPLAKPKLPPVDKLLSGAYIGKTLSGTIVCFDINKFTNPHLMILGQSGSGKSVTAKTFSSRFYDLYGTPTLVIDYAGEYVDWVLSRGGIVVDMRHNTINPFELGPATLTDRMRQIVDAFEKICEFRTINQRNAFTYYVMRAYQVKGYVSDQPKTWGRESPTLKDMIELMEKDFKSLSLTKQLTIQSLLDRLRTLASGPFGIFGQSSLSIESLTHGFVSIDLSKVTSNTLKDIIAWTILQYIDSKMRLDGIVKSVRLLIILDEAWKLCRDEKSLPVTLIKEGRKYGYSLLVSSQDATEDLAESILSNAGTVIVHKTSHPKYLSFFKRAYGLTDMEVSRIQNLAVGEALIKLGDDPRPFFVKVDMEDASAHILERNEVGTKGEIRQPLPVILRTPQPKPLEPTAIEMPSTPELSLVAPIPNLQPELTVKGDFYGNSGKTMAETGKLGKTMAPMPYNNVRLSKNALMLLDDIVSNIDSRTIERYRRTNLNDYQGNKARLELEKYGLVESNELPRVAGEGRWGKVLRLSEKGKAWANQTYRASTMARREGGAIHRHFVQLLGTKLQKHNFNVETELPVGDGRTADLVVNRSIAFEVETRGFSLSNIKKNLDYGFKKVVVVCQTKLTKEKIEHQLSDSGLDRRKVLVLDLTTLLKGDIFELLSGAPGCDESLVTVKEISR